MIKGLEALASLRGFKKMYLDEIKAFETIEKELKLLEVIRNHMNLQVTLDAQDNTYQDIILIVTDKDKDFEFIKKGIEYDT